MKSVVVDRRLKNKIEEFSEWEKGIYSVKFKDLIDTFWFDDADTLQDFLNQHSRERYYNKEVRKGYFLYTNEHNEIFKYTVESNRGKLTLISEDFLEMAQ